MKLRISWTLESLILKPTMQGLHIPFRFNFKVTSLVFQLWLELTSVLAARIGLPGSKMAVLCWSRHAKLHPTATAAHPSLLPRVA